MVRNIEGDSMSTTILDGDKILEIANLKIVNIDRGDIISFKSKDAETVIKRVIGLPNETVEIINGTVYINGKALEEDYTQLKYTDNIDALGSVKLGNDEYFVLGDNRFRSMDSRSVQIGPVKRDDIIGVYVCKIKSNK